MKNKIFLLFMTFVIATLFGCEKLYEMNQPDAPDIEYSSVWPLSGEWYVVYRFDDGSGVVDDYYGVGYTKVLTYNTAADDGQDIWITDVVAGEYNFWDYSVKCPCNVPAKTFAGSALISVIDGYDISINITNGIVIPDGGFSTTGVVTDSIYFEIEFEDDPGTIYETSGIRRTGFLEDEH